MLKKRERRERRQSWKNKTKDKEVQLIKKKKISRRQSFLTKKLKRLRLKSKELRITNKKRLQKRVNKQRPLKYLWKRIVSNSLKLQVKKLYFNPILFKRRHPFLILKTHKH